MASVRTASTDWHRLMIAELEGIGKSCLSRILRLALLAPDIVEGIPVGTADQALVLERLERPPDGELDGAARSHSRIQGIVSCVAKWRRSHRQLIRQQHRVTGAVVVQ
jgi:hypothetical protein